MPLASSPQLCAYQEYDTTSLVFLWVGYLFIIAFLPTIVITYNYGKVFMHFRNMLHQGASADTIKATAKAFFSYYVVFLVVSFRAQRNTTERNAHVRIFTHHILYHIDPSSGSPRY